MSRFPSLLSILALSAGLLAWGGVARADPPLWRVVGPQTEIDLFGSIHLLSGATQWKTPALMAELARADAVWFEIPLGGAAQADAVAMMQAKGLLPAGQTLAALLPPALEARVSALARREGLAPAALERMKPWLAELELTLVFYQRQGYREDLGVESQINAAAPSTAARGAFETLAEQVDLFADLRGRGRRPPGGARRRAGPAPPCGAQGGGPLRRPSAGLSHLSWSSSSSECPCRRWTSRL